MNRADERKAALIGTLGRGLLDTLLATVRLEVRTHPACAELERAGAPIAYALWHGRLLPLTWQRRGEGVVTLVSLSKDGEYIARIAEGWGYHVVRGSTSRGGSRALAELIRFGRRGRSFAVTPDGPRGPRERMKPGVVVAAQRAGLPMVPVTATASRAWWFEGWDRFMVPKPFSRLVVQYGPPARVDPTLDAAGIERFSERFGATLASMQSKLDAELGWTRPAAADAATGGGAGADAP